MQNTLGTIDPDAALTEGQAAEFLGVSVRTLQAWRVRGGKVPFQKIGKSVRYRKRDLVAFMESSLTSSTSAAEGVGQ